MSRQQSSSDLRHSLFVIIAFVIIAIIILIGVTIWSMSDVYAATQDAELIHGQQSVLAQEMPPTPTPTAVAPVAGPVIVEPALWS